MKKEEVKKCREDYLDIRGKIIEEWKDKLWKDVISTITYMSKEGIVIKYLQLYKCRKKVWIRIKPELSRKKLDELNVDTKSFDVERDIPWHIEVMKAFKSELGEYFTITDEKELIRDNRLTLFIM